MYNSWGLFNTPTNSVEALADTIVTEIKWTQNLYERWVRSLYRVINLPSNFIVQQRFI